jgi:predicted ArsR family transcriptional regulator
MKLAAQRNIVVSAQIALVPGGDRARASTKRAVLIGMLERPEGAAVAEIGQRLGWLPHTVRAAMTGLRHAGREVTRRKDGEGRSVYRLAAPQTVSR